MKMVAVFCGSSPGFRHEYSEAVVALADQLVEEGTTAVYGGASVGAMGVLADAVLSRGGEIVGVLPRHLEAKEIAHRGLTQLHIVDSMHERKALIADLADGFVALPGGFGTIDELAEILTWAQLGLHSKPIGLLSTLGFFDSLLQFFDHSVAEGFLRPENRESIVVGSTAPDLLAAMREYKPTTVNKWLNQAGEEVPLP